MTYQWIPSQELKQRAKNVNIESLVGGCQSNYHLVAKLWYHETCKGTAKKLYPGELSWWCRALMGLCSRGEQLVSSLKN